MATAPQCKQNERGEWTYRLTREPAPPTTDTPVAATILDIQSSDTLIVVFTAPGAANLVARLLDYRPTDSTILATLAGDDVIFITPKHSELVSAARAEVETLLQAKKPA